MAADLVADMKCLRNKDGIKYAKKAMILCCLALGVNGEPELQSIIKNYRDTFEIPEQN